MNLNSVFTTARRIGLLVQIRSLEATLQGQLDALENVSCYDTRERIQLAMTTTRQALLRARADYLALAPRSQWRAA